MATINNYQQEEEMSLNEAKMALGRISVLGRATRARNLRDPFKEVLLMGNT
jgi:hypothetical protein